jgi:hypothetical protein
MESKLKMAHNICINKTFFDDWKYQTLVVSDGSNNHISLQNPKYMIILYYKIL